MYYLVSGKGDIGVGRSSSRRQEGRERTVSYGRKVQLTVPSFPEANNVFLLNRFTGTNQTKQRAGIIFNNQIEAQLNPKTVAAVPNSLRRK